MKLNFLFDAIGRGDIATFSDWEAQELATDGESLFLNKVKKKNPQNEGKPQFFLCFIDRYIAVSERGADIVTLELINLS